MKLLIDMNLSPLWVETLETAGFEAVHWSSVGMASATDSEIMAFAKTNDFVVLTQDLDFGILLGSMADEKPSVVQFRAQDVLPHSIGNQVVDALRQLGSELSEGALVTVDPKKTRVRVLPLRLKD